MLIWMILELRKLHVAIVAQATHRADCVQVLARWSLHLSLGSLSTCPNAVFPSGLGTSPTHDNLLAASLQRVKMGCYE